MSVACVATTVVWRFCAAYMRELRTVQSDFTLWHLHQWEFSEACPYYALFRVESLPARVQSFSRLQTIARRQTVLEYAATDAVYMCELESYPGIISPVVASTFNLVMLPSLDNNSE